MPREIRGQSASGRVPVTPEAFVGHELLGHGYNNLDELNAIMYENAYLRFGLGERN
jgi:hypothetical protein